MHAFYPARKASGPRASSHRRVAEERCRSWESPSLALRWSAHAAQAAPCLVQLSALLLQVLCRLGSGTGSGARLSPPSEFTWGRKGERWGRGCVASSRIEEKPALRLSRLSPCSRGPRGPSRSPHACAAGPGRWPGAVAIVVCV